MLKLTHVKLCKCITIPHLTKQGNLASKMLLLVFEFYENCFSKCIHCHVDIRCIAYQFINRH